MGNVVILKTDDQIKAKSGYYQTYKNKRDALRRLIGLADKSGLFNSG